MTLPSLPAATCLLIGLSAISRGQTLITEVNLATKTVELTNFGSQPQSLTGWSFCHRIQYIAPGASGVGGLTTLASGQSSQYVISLLNTTSSDLGLYNSSSFGSSTAMQDFLQWGAGGLGRQSVAVTKGIWTAGTFLALPASGLSFHAKGSIISGIRFSNWFVGRPHVGFPVPPPRITSLTRSATGEWQAQIFSHFLQATHKPQYRSDLSSPWQDSTFTVADQGNGNFLFRYTPPAAESRQFSRILVNY